MPVEGQTLASVPGMQPSVKAKERMRQCAGQSDASCVRSCDSTKKQSWWEPGSRILITPHLVTAGMGARERENSRGGGAEQSSGGLARIE